MYRVDHAQREDKLQVPCHWPDHHNTGNRGRKHSLPTAAFTLIAIFFAKTHCATEGENKTSRQNPLK
jgi:hypothetical protein